MIAFVTTILLTQHPMELVDGAYRQVHVPSTYKGIFLREPIYAFRFVLVLFLNLVEPTNQFLRARRWKT